MTRSAPSVIAVTGPGAEKAAAALIRARRAGGETVAAVLIPDEGRGAGDFVTKAGALAPDAWFWLEWASGRPLGASAPDSDCIVIAAPGGTLPVGAKPDTCWDAATVALYPDALGRPLGTASDTGTPTLAIGICGSEHRHRDVNPAVLARLGDAAERLGLGLHPVFLPAAVLVQDRLPEGLHGLILPGGADMGEVEAQIVAARAARVRGLPALGLCLGMQSMATMVMRDAGSPQATLEEIAGPGPGRSFVRLHGADGAALHRLGERSFRPLPGTQLAILLPDGATLRMNHRFRLDPGAGRLPGLILHPAAETPVVDAVEMPGHPFFIGLQGHPELGCDPRLSGLWDGFLAASSRFRCN